MLDVVKIDVEDLEGGMFVSDLDRPWLGTPFLLQGFCISSEEELQQLKSICKHVFVDIKQSKASAFEKRKVNISKPQRKVTAQEMFVGRELRTYSDRTTLKHELQEGRKAVKKLNLSVNEVFEAAKKGASLDIAQLRRAAEPMVESVTRNPDACIWLARLRAQDDYTYQHSVAAAVWSVALGRQLGLPPEDLQSLAVGGLLFDIGKLRLNPELLQSPLTFEGENSRAMKAHVAHGADMIAESEVNDDVRAMVIYHHERYDGSGYPNKLVGDDIPVFARIAAVVDVFDAITSDRSYASAISPSAAIKVLNEGRGTDFQAEIVDEFIQAIGIYPAGTLVELTSGEIGVVVSECRSRRLRPKLMVLLDEYKQPLAQPRSLDLLQVTAYGAGQPLDIVTSLKPGAFGIDINSLNP